MVEERVDSAQETFPEQSHRPNSCKSGTADRGGKKEGLQDGTAQVKEIHEVSRQSISCKAASSETNGDIVIHLCTAAILKKGKISNGDCCFIWFVSRIWGLALRVRKFISTLWILSLNFPVFCR